MDGHMTSHICQSSQSTFNVFWQSLQILTILSTTLSSLDWFAISFLIWLPSSNWGGGGEVQCLQVLCINCNPCSSSRLTSRAPAIFLLYNIAARSVMSRVMIWMSLNSLGNAWIMEFIVFSLVHTWFINLLFHERSAEGGKSTSWNICSQHSGFQSKRDLAARLVR